MESTQNVLCDFKLKKVPDNGQIGIPPGNSHNPTLAKNKETPVLDQIQFGFQVPTCQWKANGLQPSGTWCNLVPVMVFQVCPSATSRITYENWLKLGDAGSLACTIFSALVRSSWRICEMSGSNAAKSAKFCTQRN